MVSRQEDTDLHIHCGENYFIYNVHASSISAPVYSFSTGGATVSVASTVSVAFTRSLTFALNPRRSVGLIAVP
jgi:hypothetical protein